MIPTQALAPLPVERHLPDILNACTQNKALLLRAPTGAGKTTRVPPALLEPFDGKILVLEPRRIAAKGAARRVAKERGWKLGGEVGYQVRFDKKWGPKSRIIYLTTGVFLRWIQRDPFLEGVSAILFDEAHERAMELDLSLAFARQVQEEVREDLALVIMSATLSKQPFSSLLPDATWIETEGRLHPVEIHYTPSAGAPNHRDLPERVYDALSLGSGHTCGHTLVFLPGVREIDETAKLLRARIGEDVFPLHGRLSPQAQDQAISDSDRPKVILATNIAESSLTVPGVDRVIDSGLMRQPRRDPARGLNRLELVRISHSSAQQRAGRAGRERPGLCVRLWTQAQDRQLPEHHLAEVMRVDLSAALLEIALWGARVPENFPWLERPPAESLSAASELLHLLGALSEGQLTEVGRSLATLPTPPRLGRVLLEARALGCVAECIIAVALLEEGKLPTSPKAQRGSSDLLYGIESFRRGRLPHLKRAVHQMMQMLEATPSRHDHDLTRRAFLAGYPDRVARRRAPDSPRALMVGHRGVVLAKESVLRGAPLFLCLDVAGGKRGAQSEALVRAALEIDQAWLETKTQTRLYFDDEKARVLANEELLFLDLVLHQRNVRPPSQEASVTLLQAAKRDLKEALGLEKIGLKSLRARWALVRKARPELGLRALDESLWHELLQHAVLGKDRFSALQDQTLPLLKGLLGRRAFIDLEREAPERYRVPSGREVAISYPQEGPPVLAVPIQELFGLTETPSLCSGRIPLQLHLLAPNQRPQQITQDLPSFWERGYPEVAKALRGRYPKHSWPDDPLTATPHQLGRRRRRG